MTGGSVADSLVNGGYGQSAAQAFGRGNYGQSAVNTVAGVAFWIGNILTFGEGAAAVGVLKGVGAMEPLPLEGGSAIELVKKYDVLLRGIQVPVTDEEARVLVQIFGGDDCFGLASALMHIIETAPGWPLIEFLQSPANDWVAELRNRCIRGGRIPLESEEAWPEEFGKSTKIVRSK